MKKQKISVVINTKNAASTLESCLKSVSFADEIIVVDMESKDETVKIAKKYSKKIYAHKDIGYADPARDFALSKATNDWILVVDADEEIPSTLQAKVLELINKKSDIDIYLLPRKNIIFNKWIEHTAWWPDYQVRLFKKGTVSWKIGVHRQPDMLGKSHKIPAKESLAIIHHNYQHISQFVERLNRYTDIKVKEEADSFSKSSLSNKDILSSFSNEFFQRYFVHLGIKDGAHGLSLSLLQSWYELITILKKWDINGFHRENINESDGISALREFQDGINYWIADYNVNRSSGIKKIYWKIRRKLKR